MSHFIFKQFGIHQDRCAMKVGTDSVLLGAWADLSNVHSLLDVGCGTGILTLMAAQRGVSQCVGIEIDNAAAEQASENVRLSPFSGQITIISGDILTYKTNASFDCILTNPPYFDENTHSPQTERTRARHTISLSHTNLVATASRLLGPGGRLQLVIPTISADKFHALCAIASFSLFRRTDIQTKKNTRPKRTLLDFRKDGISTDFSPLHDVLTLTNTDGSKTADYCHLTQDFYL